MRAPTLGEHTEQVLRSELGLDDERIAALRASRAI
jgi:CoA:oxalate CoA-transferase